MNLPKEEILKEEHYLQRVIEVITKKVSALGQELFDKEEKIKEFKEFVWESKNEIDPTEMRTLVSANDLEVELLMGRGKYFQKLYKLQNSPYFGSITFHDDEGLKDIYIGITYLDDDQDHLIYDWRSPICSLFYDYGVGKAKYQAPGGVFEGIIQKKRQFKIERGQLIRVFDNHINIDDELLQEVLATSNNDKMKNIVNTIQQEQNYIIRNTDNSNLIVQGIAGSGKTSVALHRIAYLLYKIDHLTSHNVLIFSPNKIFTEYIANVLPELGEENTMQTTFNEFASRYLKEFKEVETFTDFVSRYYKYTEKNKALVVFKQSDQIIALIDQYIKVFINQLNFKEDLITRDFTYSKDELNYMLKERYANLNLFSRLNEMAIKISEQNYQGKHAQVSHIEKLLSISLSLTKDYKEIYKAFLRSSIFQESFDGYISETEIINCVKYPKIKYEDACLMLYLKGMLEGFDYLGNIKQVVIDEAQDYNKLQYIIISKIFKRSDFTILGDINQTINPYYKYQSLADLKDIFTEDTLYMELNKTYRSSEEIIAFTNDILGLKHVCAIRKNTNIPVIQKEENANLKNELIAMLEQFKKDQQTVAIITKTDEEASKLYTLLKDNLPEINLLTSSSVEFKKAMVILPSYIAKGLEFDATIIYTNKDNQYLKDEKYLYYVACTRSQHHLIIYNQ